EKERAVFSADEWRTAFAETRQWQWAAKRAAVLVVAQDRFDAPRDRIALRQESVARVKRVVAEEFVKRAVILVRSASRHDADDAAASLAELRRQRIGLDAELFDGVHHWHDTDLVMHGHGIGRAIQEDLIAVYRSAVEADLRKGLIVHLGE